MIHASTSYGCYVLFGLSVCSMHYPLGLSTPIRVRSSSLRCDFVQLGGWQKKSSFESFGVGLGFRGFLGWLSMPT